MPSALKSGQKRQYEECERIFGDQKLFLIKELDTPPPIFERIKMSDFDDLSTLFPPLPEIFPDAALNFLAANSLYDDHLLPENENDLNLESLDNGRRMGILPPCRPVANIVGEQPCPPP